MIRLALITLLLLSGCASVTPAARFEFSNTTTEAVVWPARPDIPRYRYVGELTGETNFPADESKRGFLAKLVGLFTGTATPKILQRPHSGYTSTLGHTYVADTSRQAVFVFDRSANRLTLLEYAEPDTRFSSPVAIAEQRDGSILITDADLGLVSRFSADGRHLNTFGGDELERPTGIAVDAASGNIYISDTATHKIKVFSESGQSLFVIGSRGEQDGQFNYPTYLHISGDKLFVTDAMNARVQVLGLDGTHQLSLGARGSYVGNTPRPKGVTTDTDGNIYVVESYYDHVLIFSQQGHFLLPIGGTGATIGEFYLPAGIWSDSQDRIYVADMFNGRIVVMQYLGGE